MLVIVYLEPHISFMYTKRKCFLFLSQSPLMSLGHIKNTDGINHAADERKCSGDKYISIDFLLLFWRGDKLSDNLNVS